MNRVYFTVISLVTLVLITNLSFKSVTNDSYTQLYHSKINGFYQDETALLSLIKKLNIDSGYGRQEIIYKLKQSRLQLKGIDFWLRYLDPVVYHKINGALSVEWETEVFEKFEPPYKREGSGLSLAEKYLLEKNISKDSLIYLISSSQQSISHYLKDSITVNLQEHDHFFLANRLFLLNLAAIYTTGFECPDPLNIIPELNAMLQDVKQIYGAYHAQFPKYALSTDYVNLYDQAIKFVHSQPLDPNAFNHFLFIKDYVNPLFNLNQRMIRDYQVISRNFNDFSLDNNSNSIFDKSLYAGQNTKGIYIAVDDSALLGEIKATGKLLFYDPILSGNNKRSCASCHKPTEYFTDTIKTTSLQFDGQNNLTRNTPTLINVMYNHLIMLDGKHVSLLAQARDVVKNPIEMGSKDVDIVDKVMSCGIYEKAFRKFVKFTPNAKKISIDHIVSAVILYYSSFSNNYSPFDDAMNKKKALPSDCINGFNLFMGKAQCGTCHFVPQFNGVKPPYINSEFEVIGIPAEKSGKSLSADRGRAAIYASAEMQHAFRTSTIRNVAFTKPYMHNGVFNSLEEVIDFYDAGGGTGKGIKINNQTLTADSLKLSKTEKQQLTAFIQSLNENIIFEEAPRLLPVSQNKTLNNRKIGGEY